MLNRDLTPLGDDPSFKQLAHIPDQSAHIMTRDSNATAPKAGTIFSIKNSLCGIVAVLVVAVVGSNLTSALDALGQKRHAQELVIHNQVSDLLLAAAREWASADWEASFLLQGTRLELFSQWAEGTNLALTAGEAEFLQSSRVEHERRVAEETARKERERHLEHRARNFLVGLVGVLAVATAVALLLLSFSRQQVRLATSRELASAAINNLEVEPERSILLSLQAVQTANTREAENALHSSIQASRVRMALTGFRGAVAR